MNVRTLIVDLAVRYGFQVLGALVIVVAGLLVGRWVGGLIELRLRGRAMEPPMRVLIARAVKTPTARSSARSSTTSATPASSISASPCPTRRTSAPR